MTSLLFLVIVWFKYLFIPVTLEAVLIYVFPPQLCTQVVPTTVFSILETIKELGSEEDDRRVEKRGRESKVIHIKCSAAL